MQSTITFLLDTNEIIPAEPFAAPADGAVAGFLAKAGLNRHSVTVHPANRDDLVRRADPAQRAQKLAALAKYPMLDESPISPELVTAAGESIVGSNDHRDLRLLAAIESGAATFLVTEDVRLRARASRAGLGASVVTVAEATEVLDRLHPRDANPPPTVDLVKPYLIDLKQPLFDSLRTDYDFDQWFKTKVRSDATGRRCWVVRDADGAYDAIAIVKVEDQHPEDARRTATKLCTFKVSEARRGDKVGELLLRTILEWAHTQPAVAEIFVEAHPKHASLVVFLEQFGFRCSSVPPLPNGDLTYLKTVRPPHGSELDPLTFHVTYGPPAVSTDAPTYVIPIQPHWYLGLFPDSPAFDAHGAVPLDGGFSPSLPFGNAMRKAYLCLSNTDSIAPGATLLFYRSAPTGRGSGRGAGAVQAIGVAERSIRARSSERVLSFVGRRTVYSEADVVAMCESSARGVLATLFRHDHFLDTPWSLRTLVEAGVLNGAPQSVTRVTSLEGLAWLSERING